MADDDPGGSTKATVFDDADFVRLYDFQDGWTADAASVPAVNTACVDQHFASKDCRQLRKGWAFKEEAYVKKVMANNFDPDPTIHLVRSVCAPSMKTGHYRQLVSLSNRADIVQAYCDCVAGLSGTCQHIAGLLFTLCDIQKPSSTDVRCKWIAPAQAKKQTVSALKDITFRKHVINKTTPKQPKRRASAASTMDLPRNSKTAEILRQLESAAPSAQWSRYVTEVPRPAKEQHLIKDTEDLLSRTSLDISAAYVASVAPLSEDKRHAVCKSTLGQSVNPTWKKEKTGRLGASMFRRIVHCTRPESLVREVLYPKVQKLKPGDPRQYGIDNEPVAVSEYVSFMACQDRDVVVEETGLHVHHEYPYIAVSPDRIVSEGDNRGLLEVKCPPSKQKMTPTEACNFPDFCCHVVDGCVVLKKTHPFYFQVQGQMAVVGAQWCDFVIWTNNGDIWKSLSVERVLFDKLFWDNEILPGLKYFFRFAIVPELLTRRVRRLKFLYTTGRGYVPYLKYRDGFYLCESEPGTLKMSIRQLK